jgi:hypothetical protein
VPHVDHREFELQHIARNVVNIATRFTQNLESEINGVGRRASRLGENLREAETLTARTHIKKVTRSMGSDAANGGD